MAAIVLSTINARYVHAALGLRYLAANMGELQPATEIVEFVRRRKVPLDQIITHRTTLAGAVSDLPLWATTKTGLIKALISLD